MKADKTLWKFMGPKDLATMIDDIQHPSKPRYWDVGCPLDTYIKGPFMHDYDEIINSLEVRPEWADEDYRTLDYMVRNHPKDLKELYLIPRITKEERRLFEPIKQHLLSLV